jgi:protein-S-isoprenylcysteine O-methyltransferase Ste14
MVDMDMERVFQMTALVLLLSGLSISIYFRRKANQTGEEIDVKEEGSLILNLRRIFGLLLWLSAFAYLINPAWMAWSQLPLPYWLRWVGAGILLVCIPLVYWVFSSLGMNVTPTVVIRQEHSLVMSGPYRWVRHPLYTVGFLMFVGLSHLAANWFILLMLVLGIIPISMRTPLEEGRLIEYFGDEYRDYMQHTGRYLPRLSSLSIQR